MSTGLNGPDKKESGWLKIWIVMSLLEALWFYPRFCWHLRDQLLVDTIFTWQIKILLVCFSNDKIIDCLSLMERMDCLHFDEIMLIQKIACVLQTMHTDWTNAFHSEIKQSKSRLIRAQWNWLWHTWARNAYSFVFWSKCVLYHIIWTKKFYWS